jgi:hypothetical protein
MISGPDPTDDRECLASDMMDEGYQAEDELELGLCKEWSLIRKLEEDDDGRLSLVDGRSS